MIDSYAFGKMTVNGKTYRDDLKIVGNRVLPDWWRKKGHLFQVDDLKDIVEARPDVLVLGTGKPGLARAAPELSGYLEQRHIRLIVQPTAKAVGTFNELLSKGEHVAAGFHLTC